MTAHQFYDEYLKKIAVPSPHSTTLAHAATRSRSQARRAEQSADGKFTGGELAAGPDRPSTTSTRLPRPGAMAAGRHAESRWASRVGLHRRIVTSGGSPRRRRRHRLIPHCPKDKPHEHAWIDTHPAAHAQQVRDRNKQIGYEFARQIRILKALNRQMALPHRRRRKPLSSFHVTALALLCCRAKVDHAVDTPTFLDAGRRAGPQALPDPAGIGPDITARNPQEASRLLREAANVTAQALELTNDAEQRSGRLFGDPAKTIALVSGAPVSVSRAAAC